MTDIPSNLWQVPVYLPYLQPTLTAEAIAEAEDQLQIRLPQSYLAILKQQNGGYVRLRLPESRHAEIWGIGPYFPNIAKDHWWREGEAAAECGAWLPPQPESLIPFDGDGHWYLCLDYRKGTKNEEPGVTYLDLESEHERAIAPNFPAFLSLLRERIKPGTLGILGEHSIQEVLLAVETILNARFEPPDSSARGYPIYRCRLGTKGNPQCLWLSENDVPRGFVRPNDRRYSELIDLLLGTALRMPDRPEVKLILECTDGILDRVQRELAQSSLAVSRIG